MSPTVNYILPLYPLQDIQEALQVSQIIFHQSSLILYLFGLLGALYL
jgi:hypothetical protein